MHVFIISWLGQHENACFIAEKALTFTSEVSIVYSDPDPKFILDAPCKLIRRPNDLFWEDKFKSCLDHVGDNGMLIIHADCQCEDWTFLIQRCSQISLETDDLGVWAPRIHGTYWDLSVTELFETHHPNLFISAMTDGIVFYLAPIIVSRMQKVIYGDNKFGWGIDALFCATAHIQNKFVVIDTAIDVVHPRDTRGYDGNSAEIQMNEFMNQFTTRERIEYRLLEAYVYLNHLKREGKC